MEEVACLDEQKSTFINHPTEVVEPEKLNLIVELIGPKQRDKVENRKGQTILVMICPI